MNSDLIVNFCISILSVYGARVQAINSHAGLHRVTFTRDFDKWKGNTVIDICFDRFECTEEQIYAGVNSEFLNNLLKHARVDREISYHRLHKLSMRDIVSVLDNITFTNCSINRAKIIDYFNTKLCLLYYTIKVNCIYQQEQYIIAAKINLEDGKSDSISEVEFQHLTLNNPQSDSTIVLNIIDEFPQINNIIDRSRLQIEQYINERLIKLKHQLSRSIDRELVQIENYYQQTKEDELREKERKIQNEIAQKRTTLRGATKELRRDIRNQINDLEKKLSTLLEENSSIEREYDDMYRLDILRVTNRHRLDIEIQLLGLSLITGFVYNINVDARTRRKEHRSNLMLKQVQPDSHDILCNHCLSPMTTVVMCSLGHLVHPHCSEGCHCCENYYCESCNSSAFGVCQICDMKTCNECITTCTACNTKACSHHAIMCSYCGKMFCYACCVACSECGILMCSDDATKCRSCGLYTCMEHQLSCKFDNHVHCSKCSLICNKSFEHICKSHSVRCTICNEWYFQDYVSYKGICDVCQNINWKTFSEIENSRLRKIIDALDRKIVDSHKSWGLSINAKQTLIFGRNETEICIIKFETVTGKPLSIIKRGIEHYSNPS